MTMSYLVDFAVDWVQDVFQRVLLLDIYSIYMFAHRLRLEGHDWVADF